MSKNKQVQDVGDVSILSASVKVEGRIYSDGNLRIDGIMNGDILVNGNLTIGETAEIKGEIKAQNVTLGGVVEGSLHADQKAILESGSKLKGDLKARILVVEEGAVFDGKSEMSKDEISEE
jgi:cytoskeletal protein CcmA (bactofilin family)